jgi:hypothetical protein
MAFALLGNQGGAVLLVIWGRSLRRKVCFVSVSRLVFSENCTLDNGNYTEYFAFQGFQ